MAAILSRPPCVKLVSLLPFEASRSRSELSTRRPNPMRVYGRSQELTHWSPVTHICITKLTIIGSDKGLSPGRRQAIIWTNAGILLITPLGTNFNEFFYRNSYIFIQENAFQNVVCKIAAILSRPQCVNRITGIMTWWGQSGKIS